MKVEKKAGKGCNVDLLVKVDAAEIKETYDKTMKSILRSVSIPGFRPGKAPLAVVKSKYENEIASETQNACFREFYPKAAKESELKIVELAEVKDMKLSPETGFEFVATVEVRPEFKVPKYKKLPIEMKEIKVSDDDVTKRVEEMRKLYSKYEDAKEGAVVGEGDFAQIDFKGTIDGKPVAEFAPDAKRISEAEGFWTMIEEDRFIPEVTEALKGMKAGESKEVKVKFNSGSEPEAIRGKKAVYNVTLKSFRSRVLLDDAAFVAQMKVESMDKYREQIKDEMIKTATAQENDRRRQEALDLLVKKADFDVPDSQVRAETQNYLQRYAEQAQYAGLDAEYIKNNRDKIMKDAGDAAAKQVRLSYILAAIAEAEKVEVADADVDGRIALIAAQNGKSADEVRKMIEDAGNMPALKSQLVAEKVIELVLAEAK